MTEGITDEKARLWITGFEPSARGWRMLGPVDDGEVGETACKLRWEGVEVETFVSALGKLAYFIRGGAARSASVADIDRLYGPCVCGPSYSCRGCRELTLDESHAGRGSSGG